MTDETTLPPEETIRPELRRALERSWPGGRIAALAGDASTRRFYRVAWTTGEDTRETVIVMDYGAPFAGTTDDVVLTGVFRDAGLPVPRVLGIHDDPGFLALEDLGDTMLETALAAGGDEARRLFGEAVDLAAAVGVRGTPALERSARADGPALDRERFRFEMDFFVEHWVEGLVAAAGPDEALRSALYDLADAATHTPQRVLCHRDFHSRNLMLVAGGGLAMIDIQDARWGPDSYDLASLLYDAYVDIEPATVDAMVERYVDATGAAPVDAFRSRFDVVAAQRMVKALGTFGYQIAVRGNPRYRSAIPRTLERLCRVAPELTGQFKDVFQNPD